MKKSPTVVLIVICILALTAFAWLAWNTINSGAIIVIALIIGAGLSTALFQIIGDRLSERKTKSGSESVRKFQSTQEALSVAIEYGEEEAKRRPKGR